jgi:hypothetical protein
MMRKKDFSAHRRKRQAKGVCNVEKCSIMKLCKVVKILMNFGQKSDIRQRLDNWGEANVTLTHAPLRCNLMFFQGILKL